MTLRFFWGLLLLIPAFAFRDPDPRTTPISENFLGEIAAYPKTYFRSPVLSEIRLTGTFGELRPNHFHSGIDIKSATGKVGQSVVAAADGFVDRIGVQPGGYGNVLYVKHPNGYTTVYGHLDRFSAEIQSYVRKYQYANEKFAVDIRPKDGLLKVQKGVEIAKLGNSGGSTGPHLHFEIRNSATGKVLNPELFGLPVPDNVPPSLRDLKVYFLNEKRDVLGDRDLAISKSTSEKIYNIKGGDTVKLGGWRIGFGLKTFDSMSGFSNDNGVFSILMKVNDENSFLWRMDELDFDETRYLNAHIDYPEKENRGGYFNRCYVMPGNRMGNYARIENAGVVEIFSEKPQKIELVVTDASGNSSSLTFWALRDAENMETFASRSYQFELPFDVESYLSPENLQVDFQKNSFYETAFLQYRTSPDPSHLMFSDVHHLGDDATPVHRFFNISILPRNLPDELRSKAVIASCRSRKHENCGGQWKDGFLTTKVRSFGDFCITADTQPPTIRPVVFDRDMRKKGSMAFKIDDNFDIGGSADNLSFRGEVDGKWILFEYDKKRDRLTYDFDGHVGSGTHNLKLTVRDDRGNEAVFEKEFVR